jgi:CheY-like chemotaxis protein
MLSLGQNMRASKERRRDKPDDRRPFEASVALVLEDEPLVSMAIQAALEEIGFTRVTVAATEAEAVAAAQELRPSLITADIRLREGNGIRAVEAIWKDGSIPTVFVTATAQRLPEALEDAAVLHKPFTLERLKETVRTVMARAEDE